MAEKTEEKAEESAEKTPAAPWKNDTGIKWLTGSRHDDPSNNIFPEGSSYGMTPLVDKNGELPGDVAELYNIPASLEKFLHPQKGEDTPDNTAELVEQRDAAYEAQTDRPGVTEIAVDEGALAEPQVVEQAVPAALIETEVEPTETQADKEKAETLLSTIEATEVTEPSKPASKKRR